MPKLTARKKAQLTGHNAAVFALGQGPQADGFFSGAGDGWIVRWELDAPEIGRLAAQAGTQVFSLLYLPEWDKVVAGDMNGGLHWIALAQPEKTRNIAHHQKGVFDILRIGNFVYTAGGKGLLTRWDAAEGRSLESIQLCNQSLRCLAYSPERNELAVGASDRAIYFLDAGNLSLRFRLAEAHDNSVFALHYTPGGNHLVSGGRDAMLKVWGLAPGPELHSARPAHWYTINSIAFHPEGRWFATGSRDRSIKLWDTQTFELLKVLDASRDGGHVNSVNRLFWHPYHNFLISASDDRSMIVWEVEELS
ncbi:MAG: WD40 repeat domain-containing protein [Phaeodactylibacter sp.]|nr:WD40 repeat domain-containing protein [Phaeodactylibacter sp.]MCB9296364.1 WD40 repeat domain-containing protein [Lewinellaceae bacterium]